jgi:ATP-dependent helicase HrpB
MENPPSLLPIAAYRQDILASVDASQVTIITAETGAGKSTQVPQFLVEHGYQKVIVTQPRILAARTLSQRVREEWTERHPGEEGKVSYRTAYERDDSEETAILYCTDGLQLVREVTGMGTSSRQVLVLDEIHEWNQNMEVLVAWAKKRCQEDPGFKVLLMSATIDSHSLAAYYAAPAPIEVPGRSHGIAMGAAADLVETVLAELETNVHNILVFLPGKAEIESVGARISALAAARDVPVIPLHSQLEAEEQQLAFASYPNGKIVLSTNIAQTSVTIDDIDVVIDSGLERRTEIQDGVEGLFMAQAARADCLQRAGRAGRTKPGRYVLAPLDRMPCDPLTQRPAYAVPEIQRMHLDRLVLRLANVGLDIEGLEFFHAPDPKVIAEAKQVLLNLGAMTQAAEITALGRQMERFPVESRYARMLVQSLSYSENVQRTLAAVIAIQEVGGIVKGGSRLVGWHQFTSQTRSDLLAQYDVLLALPEVEPEQWEALGVVPKSVARATETLARLNQDLGFGEGTLVPVNPREEADLMRCIVAGQIDQVWVVGSGFLVSHVSGGERRELSGGTLVPRAGLLSGTPFDLEIPTQRGLETLYLFQDVTAVDPEWLEDLGPQFFTAVPGKAYFDSYRGCLARHWQVTYKGLPVRGASMPILEPNAQNRALFRELYGEWLHARVEEDRIRLQKESGQRVHAVPLKVVQEKLGEALGGKLSLSDLSVQQLAAVSRLAGMKAYLGDQGMRRLGGKHAGKKGGHAHRGKRR